MGCFDFVADRVWEELNDAETYIDKAIEYKETNRPLADLLVQLSAQELGHSGLLKQQLTKMANGEGKELWKSIADWMFPKFASKEEKVRRMHEIYKG